jgi:hypothetical protein
MPIRLTILLLLAIFGVMYMAPDAPPRPERAAQTDEGNSVLDATRERLSAVQDALRDAAPTQDPGDLPPGSSPSAPQADAPVQPPPAQLQSQRTETADLPNVTVTPPATGTEPITLPGLGFGIADDDTASAMSLSDGARARAAQAAGDTASGALGQPSPTGVADATNDLLRGLVAEDPAAPDTQSAPVTGLPQPTDPLPPPSGQLARVTGTAVNLRAGPSTANAVVGQVTLGQTVRVLDPDSDGWATIEVPATGEQAYIAARFLEVLP